MSIKSNVAGLALVLGAVLPVTAQDLPATDPGLFQALFTGSEVPRNWISTPALLSGDLTPQMLAAIVDRLSANGGQYISADKSADGWLMHMKNGDVRARIVRGTDGLLIGVFFGKVGS